MDSTPTIEKTEAPRDDKAMHAPGDAPDRFARAEDALSRLVAAARAEVRTEADPHPAGPAPDFAVEPRIASHTIELADLVPQVAPPQRRRRVVRFLCAVGLGVVATLAWQSYGQAARQMIAAYVPALAPAISTAVPAMPAASEQPATAQPRGDAPASVSEPAAAAAPDLTPQIDAMARDLAALRQSVQQLGAGQEHVSRALAKLQAGQDEFGRKLATAPQQQAAAPPQPPRRPAARPAQAATQATGQGSQPPAPQALAPGPRPLWQSFETPPPRRPPASMP